MQLPGEKQGYDLGLFITTARLHHFPHSGEVGGSCCGRSVSVLNNYRQLNWWLFCIIDGFLFLNRAKSGCTVTRRTFLRNSLTVC